MASLDVQRAQLAAWVERVTSDLRAANGWSMRDVIARSNIGKDTIYAWKRGDWSAGAPKMATVSKFCDGLGLDQSEPYAILGWLASGPPEPQQVHPQISQDLTRVIRDPNVDEAEKRLIVTIVARVLSPHLKKGGSEAA